MNGRRVINPRGGGIDIADVDAYLAACDDIEEPMVDVGNGMLIPLRELVCSFDDTGGDADGPAADGG